MKPTNFAMLLSKYLLSYLPAQRGLQDNTIASYEASFTRLITYCTEEKGIPLQKITIEKLTSDFIMEYLNWLETERGNSPSTRNQRLSAIKAFFCFVQKECPRYILNCQQIAQIPGKKCCSQPLSYLSHDEVKEMLAKPAQSSDKGFRDLVIMSLLYDSGARVSELINLSVRDIRLGKYASVKLTGKGNKTREVPLSNGTANWVKAYIVRNHLSEIAQQPEYLFQNTHGSPFTRAGITYILQKYAPANHKKITPHVLRHTKAMHLLQSGVNIYYIRNILGHVDIKTTEIYARADTEMKRKALEKAYPVPVPELEPWQNNRNLMDWLRMLSK